MVCPESLVAGVAESLGPGVASCLVLRRVSRTSGVAFGGPRQRFVGVAMSNGASEMGYHWFGGLVIF